MPSPQDDVVQNIGYKLYPSDFSPADTTKTTTTDASKFTYRDEFYKNRSSGKTDSQKEKRSLGSYIIMKIVSENPFSGKTYFYTIASRIINGGPWPAAPYQNNGPVTWGAAETPPAARHYPTTNTPRSGT